MRHPDPRVSADDLKRRPAGDPELTFVALMAMYAGAVLRGELPSPYTEEQARRFARACLIPAELVERPALDVPHVARAPRRRRRAVAERG